jgi:cyclohexyl-isocyanide hydratase
MSPADGFLKAVPAIDTGRKRIGIPLYSNFDSLDVLGPFQTFTMAADRLEPKLLAASKAPVRSFEGVEITPHATFDETKSLDVLFVPGGIKLEDILQAGGPDENPLLSFLRRIGRRDDENPRLITSVCTGALFLAAAGLLQGFRATTHWNYKSVLAMFPGVTVADGYPRFVIDANRITGGGISSGLDEAMAMVALLLDRKTARRGQLTMQYAPNPPFNDGDPSVADPSILFDVTNSMREGVVKTVAGFQDYIQKWGDKITS